MVQAELVSPDRNGCSLVDCWPFEDPDCFRTPVKTWGRNICEKTFFQLREATKSSLEKVDACRSSQNEARSMRGICLSANLEELLIAKARFEESLPLGECIALLSPFDIRHYVKSVNVS